MELNRIEFGLYISDILIAIVSVCCYIFFIIKTKPKKTNKVRKYWSLFFLFEAISFLLGGIAHGFIFEYSNPVAFVSWCLSVLGVLFFSLGVFNNVDFKNIIVNEAFILSIAGLSMLISYIYDMFFVIILYCFIIFAFIIYLNEIRKIISFKYDFSKGILTGTMLFILSSIIFMLDVDILYIKSGVLAHIVIAVGMAFFGYGCMRTIIEYESNII